jgi:hypothetical protein
VLVKVYCFEAFIRQVLEIGQRFKVEPTQVKCVGVGGRQLLGFGLINHAQASKINNSSKI